MTQTTQEPTAAVSWVGGRAAGLAILVAALGYFVDIYDLILFGMVRVKSLVSLGVSGDAALASTGLFLFNMQMIGMLVGGVLWGVLADRRGRLSVLFGSIVMYSLANLANGAVTSVDQYAVCRLIAGIGLAGELGAGVTLVAELMPKHSRGWGTTLVALVGVCGCLVAAVVSGAIPAIYDGVHWRTAYYIGGGLGLALLALRVGVVESGMFKKISSQSTVSRGNFLALFTSRARAKRYISIVLIGIPIWFVIGTLVMFCKEIGGAMGLSPVPKIPTALFICYAGLAVGDVAAGALSQYWRSRRRAFTMFLGGSVLACAFYFVLGAQSHTWFYASCFVLGLGAGYWALFVTTASELFGTNLRATATTTAPNFVRGAVVPVNLAFEAIAHSQGMITAAIVMGSICFAFAAVALWGIEETFGRDLDFVE
jgi:MFS transporter, putative metabolite:H+ symporter